ncbi:DNA methyltransferase [Escherichia coli]
MAAEKHQRGELEQPHHQLVSTYSELNRQYASLLEEYKSLRRYFSVSAVVPYTDVWTNSCRSIIGKHPVKPADMLRQIITASSRPGDLVADFFMGSGRTSKRHCRWNAGRLAWNWKRNVLIRRSEK